MILVVMIIMVISGGDAGRSARDEEAACAPRPGRTTKASVSPPLRSEQIARDIMTVRQFTREEVSKKTTKTEAIFIIDNVVYDVTKFLDEHPGGHEVLVNVAGKDASEDFDDVGHSLDAKELMQKFVVGEVVEAERISVPKRQMSWEDSNKQDTETSFTSSWKFPVLLGIVVTVLYTYLFG